MLTDFFCTLLIATWYGKFFLQFLPILIFSHKRNCKTTACCQIFKKIKIRCTIFKNTSIIMRGDWRWIQKNSFVCLLIFLLKAWPLFKHIIFLCHTQKNNPTRFIGVCMEKMKGFSCFVRNLIHSHRWPSSGVILIMR